MHPGAGDLVDTDQHRFSGFPTGRAVFDKIVGNLFQALICSNDLVVLTQQLVQQRFLVGIEFSLFNFSQQFGCSGPFSPLPAFRPDSRRPA